MKFPMNQNIIKQKGMKILWYSKIILIVFQSPFQAELFSKNKHIFADDTFYIAPIFSYQVFITRTYVTELNCFYTISFSILKNKKQTTYEILIEEIKKKF